MTQNRAVKSYEAGQLLKEIRELLKQQNGALQQLIELVATEESNDIVAPKQDHSNSSKAENNIDDNDGGRNNEQSSRANTTNANSEQNQGETGSRESDEDGPKEQRKVFGDRIALYRTTEPQPAGSYWPLTPSFARLIQVEDSKPRTGVFNEDWKYCMYMAHNE
jgi:hypothetical protein